MENKINDFNQLSTKSAALVPADEQAVDQVQTEQAPVIVVVPPQAVQLAISEEERAISSKEAPDEFEAVKRYGALSAIAGMANIQPVFDNRLYAAIYVDENSNRSIVFCERYKDGTFSPRMRVGQSDLYLLQMFNTASKEPLAVKMRKKATSFLANLMVDYLAKYNGNNPLDMRETLQVLLDTKDMLPVYEAQAMEQTPEQFYGEVLEQIRLLNVSNAHRAYYALELHHINTIAKEMDMRPKELLEKLKEYGFLYLTNSSAGYKTNVRVNVTPASQAMKEAFFKDGNSFTMWAYCVYKKEHIEKVVNS